VHLIGGMTIDTGHSRFEMHITGNLFVRPGLLVFDPAAMTGGTIATHGWGWDENMPFQQTTAHVSRLADMAITAGRMT
jgi:hypothetical protein